MRRVLVLAVVVAAALAAAAGAARGGPVGSLFGGNCGATAPVFWAWGDPASYYFAPNGGLESGSSGWSLGRGAAVVTPQNEPWYLAGPGTHALQLKTGATASIDVCYGVTYPAVRFFASGVGGDATVHVRVVAQSLLGVLAVLDGGTFRAGQGWAPSPKLSTLFSALAAPFGTKTMQLRFTSDSGTVQIDDLFVDPFLSKS